MSQFVAAQSTTGTVGATSAALVAENMGRRGLTIVNTHASQDLSIQLCTSRGTAPTAVAGQGVFLHGQGSSWTTDFKGSCAIIGSGSGTTYSIAEW